MCDGQFSYNPLRSLQFFMTEIFWTIHDENPSFMKDIFVIEESRYNLRFKFRLLKVFPGPPQNMVWKQYLSESNLESPS